MAKPREQDALSTFGVETATETSSEEKAANLQRFLGPVEKRDAETAAYWREASPESHAQAMIELAEYAERMVEQTGYGKDDSEVFPGIPRPRLDGSGRSKRPAR